MYVARASCTKIFSQKRFTGPGISAGYSSDFVESLQCLRCPEMETETWPRLWRLFISVDTRVREREGARDHQPEKDRICSQVLGHDQIDKREGRDKRTKKIAKNTVLKKIHRSRNQDVDRHVSDYRSGPHQKNFKCLLKLFNSILSGV